MKISDKPTVLKVLVWDGVSERPIHREIYWGRQSEVLDRFYDRFPGCMFYSRPTRRKSSTV